MERLKQHNTQFFAKSYTSKAIDWEMKLALEFPNRIHARNAERFIKKMKSRHFIERLIDDHGWLTDKFR
jgi:putative endonuclease